MWELPRLLSKVNLKRYIAVKGRILQNILPLDQLWTEVLWPDQISGPLYIAWFTCSTHRDDMLVIQMWNYILDLSCFRDLLCPGLQSPTLSSKWPSCPTALCKAKRTVTTWQWMRSATAHAVCIRTQSTICSLYSKPLPSTCLTR